MPILITLAVVIAIAVMTCKGVKGAVLWGILGGTVLYYLLGITVPGFYADFGATLNLNPFSAFEAFGASAFGRVFTEGFDFSYYLADHNVAQLALLIAPRRWPSAWWICLIPSAPCTAPARAAIC